MTFGKQLEKYINHFNLSEVDIANLIGVNSVNVHEIIKGTRDASLKTINKISGLFGLSYYEFGDPKFPLPKVNDLPQDTQIAIEQRKKKGNPEIIRNNDLNLGIHVRKVLESKKLLLEFASSDILQLLPDEVKNQITSRRITDLLRKGELKAKVEDTGKTIKIEGKRGPKEILFRLKDAL